MADRARPAWFNGVAVFFIIRWISLNVWVFMETFTSEQIAIVC